MITDKPKENIRQIRISDEQNAFLQTICDTMGYNMSDAIRFCIANAMWSTKQATTLANTVVNSYFDKNAKQATMEDALRAMAEQKC